MQPLPLVSGLELAPVPEGPSTEIMRSPVLPAKAPKTWLGRLFSCHTGGCCLGVSLSGGATATSASAWLTISNGAVVLGPATTVTTAAVASTALPAAACLTFVGIRIYQHFDEVAEEKKAAIIMNATAQAEAVNAQEVQRSSAELESTIAELQAALATEKADRASQQQRGDGFISHLEVIDHELEQSAGQINAADANARRSEAGMAGIPQELRSFTETQDRAAHQFSSLLQKSARAISPLNNQAQRLTQLNQDLQAGSQHVEANQHLAADLVKARQTREENRASLRASMVAAKSDLDS